jgi:hypothetical protein
VWRFYRNLLIDVPSGIVSSGRILAEVAPIGLHGVCDMYRYPSATIILGRFQYRQPGFSLVLYLLSHQLHRLDVI